MARQQVRYAELTITPSRPPAAVSTSGRSWTRSRTPARPRRPSSGPYCAGASTSRRGRPRIRRGDRPARHRRPVRPRARLLRARRPEIGVPRPQFKPYFDRAIAAGLRSVPHAGETTGPETVWDALNESARRAHRPRHEFRPGPEAAGAPRRAPHPAGGLPDLQHRDARRPHARGAPHQGVHARGRDRHRQLGRPAEFGTDLNNEYAVAARLLDLDERGLASLAGNGVEASFLDDAGKAKLIAEIDAYTAAWLAP